MNMRATLLILAGLLAGCTGLQSLPDSGDISRSLDPPPSDWEAAVLFSMWPSSRVEFFNGRRTHVVTLGDSIPEAFGRTGYYRAYVRDTAATVFRIRVRHPAGGVTDVNFPLRLEQEAFYSIVIALGTYDVRSMGTNRYRAYPVPASAQRLPSDSLYVAWGARERGCWTCPS